MRLTKVFRLLLALQAAVRVVDVDLRPDAFVIFVDVEIRGRRMTCSRCCRRSNAGTYDAKQRLWRHLDLGPWELYLRARQRRFRCRRCDAIVTEAVPWAEPSSAFTRDFEDLVSFLAQQTNHTAISRMMHVAWPTVGNIVRRTVNRRGIPLARRKLYSIGIDEIAYRRHHKYLTIVADHVGGDVVWGGEGKSGASLDPFLDALGDEGRRNVQLVSMDMSEAYIAKVRERLPHVTIVFDPFHVVKLANQAVDEVRRGQVRALKGQSQAQGIKKTRWILLKAPEHLDGIEQEKLAVLARVNRALYRAYLLKEALRDVYSYPPARLPAFVQLARTIREHRKGILAAIEHGLSNGRLEGLNNKIRLLSHRAFGFHSAEALLALVYLCCSAIELPLPSDRRPGYDPFMLAFEDRF